VAVNNVGHVGWVFWVMKICDSVHTTIAEIPICLGTYEGFLFGRMESTARSSDSCTPSHRSEVARDATGWARFRGTQLVGRDVVLDSFFVSARPIGFRLSADPSRWFVLTRKLSHTAHDWGLAAHCRGARHLKPLVYLLSAFVGATSSLALLSACVGACASPFALRYCGALRVLCFGLFDNVERPFSATRRGPVRRITVRGTLSDLRGRTDLLSANCLLALSAASEGSTEVRERCKLLVGLSNQSRQTGYQPWEIPTALFPCWQKCRSMSCNGPIANSRSR
jgi:hypothetical protein